MRGLLIQPSSFLLLNKKAKKGQLAFCLVFSANNPYATYLVAKRGKHIFTLVRFFSSLTFRKSLLPFPPAK